MSRLLARLRRRMAPTAAFQSNQNDRVTLERRGEDIFLASRSHGDAAFFFFIPTPPPSLYLFDLSPAPTPVTWPPGSCRDACLAEGPKARDVGGGPSPPREQTQNRMLHIACSSLTTLPLSLSFFFFFVQAASIKCCSLPAG